MNILQGINYKYIPQLYVRDRISYKSFRRFDTCLNSEFTVPVYMLVRVLYKWKLYDRIGTTSRKIF